MKKLLNNLLLKVLAKFITVENVSAIVARLVAKLISHCQKKGDAEWERAKRIIGEVNRYSSLFMQIYEDDKLTDEEEKMLAEAIARGDTGEKISDILERFKGSRE